MKNDELTPDAVITELYSVIRDRQRELPEDSYTASLLTHEKGTNVILEKLGEEMTELLLAATESERDAVLHETADIIYHLLVLMAAKDIEIEELVDELRSRRQ